MSLKTLLLCLIVFGLGLGIGRTFFGPIPAPPSAISSDSFPPHLREKLQQLTEADIEEYYRLKNSEEKFKKADEILGKIMQIFLADLGLHFSQHAVDSSREKFVPATVSAVSESKNVKPAAPAVSGHAPTHFRSSENQLVNVRDERSVEAALRQVKITNFAEELKKSGNFSNRNDVLRSISGLFSGIARVTLGKQPHVWSVNLEIAAGMVQSQLNGTTKVSLSENGKEFSASNDRGSITNFREFMDGSTAVIVRASPNIFFQLYYLKDLDLLAGNIYRREAEEQDYNYAGTVSLRRQ